MGNIICCFATKKAGKHRCIIQTVDYVLFAMATIQKSRSVDKVKYFGKKIKRCIIQHSPDRRMSRNILNIEKMTAMICVGISDSGLIE